MTLIVLRSALGAIACLAIILLAIGQLAYYAWDISCARFKKTI